MGEVTDVRAAVDGLWWFHTIDLGNGIVTPGTPPNEVLERPGSFPDVRARSVLDIGTWDGKYAFRAEQAGASRVVALDHYAWCVDFAERNRYWQACEADGLLPDPDRDMEEFWHAESMPGRRCFELAKEVLGSKVEPVVGDFMTIDLENLGVFDVVLYFGVLYHMREPLTALRRLRQVTGQVAAIETAAVRVPGYDDLSLLAFYPGNELSADYGNWFAPTQAALHGLCRAAGFRSVETRVGPRTRPPAPRWIRKRPARLKNVHHPVEYYRAVVHAFP
jgi:tRNA (mo5U34)-methyltransferase